MRQPDHIPEALEMAAFGGLSSRTRISDEMVEGKVECVDLIREGAVHPNDVHLSLINWITVFA